ncbi:4'-demethylrebeccamycin synthase-like [Oppia nitens]|uniref:4'-demethylrebeccamycin synthase-like n=1 Tax=Oppia nitens TaxID=1686743 RepID=UPI0023DCCF44|nr:4'-demethylrebeccamycin synthase-like [Oppia nitens]
MSESKRLTILMTPEDSWGHINPLHGIADELVRRGHRVVFVLEIGFKGQLRRYGFDEEHVVRADSTGDCNYRIRLMANNCHLMETTDAVDVLNKLGSLLGDNEIESFAVFEPQYRAIIERVDPDIIITDAALKLPAIISSGRPWISVHFWEPLEFHNNLDNLKLPTPGLGLSTNSGNTKQYQSDSVSLDGVYDKLIGKYNDFIKANCPPESIDNYSYETSIRSPYLNIYQCIQELDYPAAHPLPANQLRVENIIRETTEMFDIPVPLNDKTLGKLIYLSFGTKGWCSPKHMTRVINILAKTEHRYIVSFGPFYDKNLLPDNMYGQQFLPHTAVLSLVDLVVTNGGNNTITESLYYGKPLIVLPLFDDQFDIAQRVHETGLGVRLNPFEFTDEELMAAVNSVLNNQELRKRLKTIGQRIRKTNDKKVIADLLEKLV